MPGWNNDGRLGEEPYILQRFSGLKTQGQDGHATVCPRIKRKGKIKPS